MQLMTLQKLFEIVETVTLYLIKCVYTFNTKKKNVCLFSFWAVILKRNKLKYFIVTCSNEMLTTKALEAAEC